jgi:type IV pilus assembly protein PilY1
MKWKSLLSVAALTVAAGLGPAPSTSAGAGNGVDLADAPLVSGLTKPVPPNVYFILDDSRSMNWEFVPDAAWAEGESDCFKNHGFNTVYYNPAVKYVPPTKADGTSYPDASFDNAPNDGFDALQGTTDLGEKFVPYVLGDNRNFTLPPPPLPPLPLPPGWVPPKFGPAAAVPEPAYYFRHIAKPDSPPATCEPNGQYAKVVVGAAERQNFANWYSYYRTRLLTMKSAAGRAFATLDDTLRVGFVTINEPAPKIGSARFLKLDRFEGQHRADWYAKLYGAGCPPVQGDIYDGSCGTPLRGALSKAGQLFAGKVLVGADDPVQYSCQQNFSILTTDGYWNTGAEGPAFGPKQIDNATDVGDQDGVDGVLPPYFDALKTASSLADIAMYYYATDLRPPGSTGGAVDGKVLNVSEDNVPAAGVDTATWQHMTTFTLGFGVSGVLGYTEDYLTGGSADYEAIVQGAKGWPDPHTDPLDPLYGSITVPERVDDLWHAAVNGRGQYLNAGNPDALVSALTKALAAIKISNAAAAAAATSSLQPVAGDNIAYVAQYTTGQWSGELKAREFSLDTGELSKDVKWSAAELLQKKVDKDEDGNADPHADIRTIYTFDDAKPGNLKPFVAGNLADEIGEGFFKSGPANPGGGLTQFATWNDAQQAAVSDEVMINFLRGQSGYEDEAGNPVRLFRDRKFVLGDIVNASPVYVGKPGFSYGDEGYTAFATDNAGRPGVVYAGANDGMLHAFDAETGAERWAYVPRAVIPDLYKLADAGYANKHRFYVDGPITVGDAYDPDDEEWKTVLVGGLGRGGRAYYALDVTDPDHPKALWEFGTGEDEDLGYTYGPPILTKNAAGLWIVVFASGYNNIAPGDGKGRLFVVDAFTGEKLDEILTDDNDVPDESGIAKANNYVANSLVDNTTQYVYGGDLAGNLWRFDLVAGASQRLGRTAVKAGDQPITVRPELGRVKDALGTYHRVVFFGTGRFLGFSDLEDDAPSNAVTQAIYAVKDSGEDLGILTGQDANLEEQELDATVTPRKIPNPLPVNWAQQNGWYLETPVGERFNVDPRLQLGTLAVLSNEVDDDECQVGGRSWLYALDYKTGGPVTPQEDKEVGQYVGAAIGTGISLVLLPNKKMVAVVPLGDTSVRAMNVRVTPGAAAEVRRVGWRELY